jgi:hypothetical protein
MVTRDKECDQFLASFSVPFLVLVTKTAENMLPLMNHDDLRGRDATDSVVLRGCEMGRSGRGIISSVNEGKRNPDHLQMNNEARH